MWERRLLPLEEIKAFLLLLKVIRLQVERGLEKALLKLTSLFPMPPAVLFNQASNMALGMVSRLSVWAPLLPGLRNVNLLLTGMP